MTNITVDYVLYADDDDDDRQFLRHAFDVLVTDKTLYTFPGGNELLQFLAEKSADLGMPSLIILDQNMPKLMGDEMVSMLKLDSRYEDIPIVIFSTSRLPLRVATQHAVAIVQKPMNLKDWEKMPFLLLKQTMEKKDGLE